MINNPGISCPVCGGATEVKDSRPLMTENSIRRRRRCVACGHRFTTFEAVLQDEPTAREADSHTYRRTTEMRALFRDLDMDDQNAILGLLRRWARAPAEVVTNEDRSAA